MIQLGHDSHGKMKVIMSKTIQLESSLTMPIISIIKYGIDSTI